MAVVAPPCRQTIHAPVTESVRPSPLNECRGKTITRLGGWASNHAPRAMRPNTVVMGGAVYSIIRTHPEVRQQIRYKAGGKQIASKEDLAVLWDVASVVVGDAISVDEDDAASDVWGKFVVVAYTAVGALSRAEPTFGYGYTLNGTPLVEQPYWDAKTNSWLFGVCEEWSNEIVGKDAGYLIATAIS